MLKPLKMGFYNQSILRVNLQHRFYFKDIIDKQKQTIKVPVRKVDTNKDVINKEEET